MIRIEANPAIEANLDKRLAQQKDQGKLEGEQWFRNPLGWLLVCFNNPLNYKNPNGELIVLQNNKDSIAPYIRGLHQIHYGMGVGETELELIRFELEQSGRVSLEGIDVNKTFVQLFAENLKDKKLEYGDVISATLYQDLFQNYRRTTNSAAIHVILGGTIGNFDSRSQELWEILSRNSQANDLVLIGLKTQKYFDIDKEKYRTNKYYPDFVLNHIPNPDLVAVSWESDEDGYIRMFYENSEVFRTRRFDLDDLRKEAQGHGFSYKDHWICEYGHSGVILLVKLNTSNLPMNNQEYGCNPHTPVKWF
jgi:hypothetical protein